MAVRAGIRAAVGVGKQVPSIGVEEPVYFPTQASHHDKHFLSHLQQSTHPGASLDTLVS